MNSIPLKSLDVNWLKQNYLTGIALIGENGQELPDPVIEDKIKTAISQLESDLDISIFERTICDENTFSNSYNYLRTRYRPIIEVISIKSGTSPIDISSVVVDKKLGDITLPPLGSTPLLFSYRVGIPDVEFNMAKTIGLRAAIDVLILLNVKKYSSKIKSYQFLLKDHLDTLRKEWRLINIA